MVSAVTDRLSGIRSQFYIEVLFGVSFLVGFGYLIFNPNPVVAAFEGGIVLGYFLHVWEKMVSYEKVLEREVSRKAETRVSEEVDEQVGDVGERIEEQFDEEMETVGERIEEEVGDAVAEEMEEVDERIEERVAERVDE